MILVDTSVWINHFRAISADLASLLEDARVCTHPMVIGELAVGSLRHRTSVLALLDGVPSVNVATHAELLHVIDSRRLYGIGLSFVDAHLIAGVLLTPGVTIWTRDKALHAAAADVGVAASVPSAQGKRGVDD